MMLILVTIFITISTVFSAFFVYLNNINAIIESEVQEKIEENGVLYGLQFGQTCTRAKTLDDQERVLPMGYMKKIKDDELDKLNARMRLLPDGAEISVSVQKEK